MSNQIRDDLISRIWNGVDPFKSFPKNLYRPDGQGWGSTHPYLVEGVREIKPQIAVEVGVWKGASTIVMANEMRALGLTGAFISIDTWLGSWENWENPEWFASLAMEHGQPMMVRTFLANVVAADLQDTVIPMQIDSVNAANILAHRGVQVDLMHLDGGHEYGHVIADLQVWWPLIRPGGMLVGDDYVHTGQWPGVRKAFDEFFGAIGLGDFEHGSGKCRVRKPL